MDKITIQNYRCFRERQTARLAPLTLLVGNNSTGKTSFLALIRALWEVAFLNEAPDFRKDPYDLGAFQDIAHNRGRGGQAGSFDAGFDYRLSGRRKNIEEEVSFSVTFEERRASPFPVARRITDGQTSLEACIQNNGKYVVRFSTPKADDRKSESEYPTYSQDETRLPPFRYLLENIIEGYQIHSGENAKTSEVQISIENRIQLDVLAYIVKSPFIMPGFRVPPFAGAPVRSRPRRTYDPVRPSRDPEGEYIPTYLASLSLRSQGEWSRLKAALEDFGAASGLFDEITIKSLGETEGTPFQVQIRKFGERKTLKGPPKNLIDVGYGVSQALPVITELLRADPSSPQMFLLQQPEVHLHPSAQAALGSLFCSIVADTDRQIIVETHSDHLLDRVRMDVRDKRTSLKPEDVSILFFERDELDVNIHSIGLDKEGNILDAPPSYRQFFMAETRRSIGL